MGLRAEEYWEYKKQACNVTIDKSENACPSHLRNSSPSGYKIIFRKQFRCRGKDEEAEDEGHGNGFNIQMSQSSHFLEISFYY